MVVLLRYLLLSDQPLAFPKTALIKTEVYHNECLINKGDLRASARAIVSKLGIDECNKGTTTIKSSRLLEKTVAPIPSELDYIRKCNRPYLNPHQMRQFTPTYSDSSDST